MGSLIPSEMWDWSRHWPLVVKAAVVAAVLFAIIVLVTVF